MREWGAGGEGAEIPLQETVHAAARPRHLPRHARPEEGVDALIDFMEIFEKERS